VKGFSIEGYFADKTEIRKEEIDAQKQLSTLKDLLK